MRHCADNVLGMTSPYNQYPHSRQPQQSQGYPPYSDQSQQPGNQYNVHNQPPLGQQPGVGPNEPKKDNTTKILVGVLAGLITLVFVVAGVGLFLVANKDKDSSPVATAAPTQTPEITFSPPTITVTSTPTGPDLADWARQNRGVLNRVTGLVNATLNAINNEPKSFGKTMKDLRDVSSVSDQLTPGEYRTLYQDQLTSLSDAAAQGITYYATGDKKDGEKFKDDYADAVAMWSIRIKALNLVLDDNEKLDEVKIDS